MDVIAPRVAVMGGGSFGTALASIAASGGASVRQWMRDPALVESINGCHRNPVYLPDYPISEAVVASTDMAWVLDSATLVLVAIPSKAFRGVVKALAPYIKETTIVVSTTKGIEAERFTLMSEILAEETVSQHIGALSGPNLAAEVAQYQLTGTVIASDDEYTRTLVQRTLTCDYFRVYASNDRYGVELAGSLKNIYAIASGIAHAKGMGENTQSMLITRALAEMSRFAVSLGANPMTFLGLAGVGDLIVTCSSSLSRNYRVGVALGNGLSLSEAVSSLGQVAEGVNTLKLIYQRALSDGIDMPLVSGLYRIVFDNAPVSALTDAFLKSNHASDVEFTLPEAEIMESHARFR